MCSFFAGRRAAAPRSGCGELALGADPVGERVALGARDVERVRALRDLLVARGCGCGRDGDGRALPGRRLPRGRGLRRGLLRHGEVSFRSSEGVSFAALRAAPARYCVRRPTTSVTMSPSPTVEPAAGS